MSSKKVKCYIQKVSPAQLPKHELSKCNISRHAKVNEERPLGLSWSTQRNTGSGRTSSSGKGTLTNYPIQIVNPEGTHLNNTV